MIDWERYCNDHASEFSKSNDRQVRAFLGSPLFFLSAILTLILISLNSSRAIGIEAAFSFIPAVFLLTMTFFIARRSEGGRFPYNLSAVAVFDLLAATILSGMLHYIYASYNRGVFHHNAPLQMTLICLGLLSFRASYKANMVRNLALAVFAGSFIFWMDPGYFNNIAIQLPAAFFPALIGNYYIVRLNRISFYLAHSNFQQKEHAFSQLTKLVYPHQMKHIEVGGEIEDSMPQGTRQAYVMTLDLVGSSKLALPNAQDLVKNFFEAAASIMMEHYRIDDLSAKAFLLKETGDGFICTVGYPFKCPKGQNEVVIIEDLAKSFAVALRDCFKGYPEVLPQFAIGVGAGEVSTYFSHGPIKKYDVSGKAIVLSARHEAIRKRLFFHSPISDCLLILPNEVYQKLPDISKRHYYCWDLLRSRIVIQDNREAQVLYMRYLTRDDGVSEFEQVYEEYLRQELGHLYNTTTVA